MDHSVDLWFSFLAGFFGSMHCVGMCGPIVIAYATQGIPSGATKFSTVAAHCTYNGGRVLSYVIAGALFGLAGKGLTTLQGIGFWFSLTVGTGLLLSGLALLHLIPVIRFSETIDLTGAARNAIERVYRASFGILISMPKFESKFYLGLLTPLLPCGLLYSMLLKAAETGNAAQGALMMLLFGLGIVPALVLTGLAGSYFSTKIRTWGDRIAAITIILMGVSLIFRALGVPLPFTGTHSH